MNMLRYQIILLSREDWINNSFTLHVDCNTWFTWPSGSLRRYKFTTGVTPECHDTLQLLTAHRQRQVTLAQPNQRGYTQQTHEGERGSKISKNRSTLFMDSPLC